MKDVKTIDVILEVIFDEERSKMGGNFHVIKVTPFNTDGIDIQLPNKSGAFILPKSFIVKKIAFVGRNEDETVITKKEAEAIKQKNLLNKKIDAIVNNLDTTIMEMEKGYKTIGKKINILKEERAKLEAIQSLTSKITEGSKKTIKK